MIRKKPAPHLMRGGYRFSPRDKREAFARRSCSNKKIERDDDSKKSHPALIRQAVPCNQSRTFCTKLLRRPRAAHIRSLLPDSGSTAAATESVSTNCVAIPNSVGPTDGSASTASLATNGRSSCPV